MHIKHILVATNVKGSTDALQTALQLAKHHHAKVTCVCIMEIPNSLPLSVELKETEKKGEEALKRAEAVAREYHLNLELELIRSRSVNQALLQLMGHRSFDLLVIGVAADDLNRKGKFAMQSEKFLKASKSRIIFCKS